ncbi:hypothetical protein [Chlorobium phaeovibrioides]|uniref:hypothetical protein n=1 Tax=Chlorobium phaeovibrioides TaxID=1094 RepID=UPI00174E7168|nr:hypothetical protein [Chlorobium phaeovibrioides]
MPETQMKTSQTQPPMRPPASQDLRFVIKESMRLGLRFLVEVERALKKLNS